MSGAADPLRDRQDTLQEGTALAVARALIVGR